MFKSFAIILLILLLTACDNNQVWNNPYQQSENTQSIYYSSFSERPKHLDPARSYSSSEWGFISQIYEPPLQYHFLDRPYRLVPMSASRMPSVKKYNKANELLDDNASVEDIAYTDYIISIRPDVRYQPHPALVKNADGTSFYNIDTIDLKNIHSLTDFPQVASRQATADDFIYQIKRLAFTDNHSPVAGLMGEYIEGFSEFSEKTKKQRELLGKEQWLDLRQSEMSGVIKIDELTYRIRIKGSYPQFQYWLAMNFFAPMPWEAEQFYALPGMKDKNISLDWFPIGTGAYMLSENNPNLRMVMEKNPEFHPEYFPESGAEGDKQKGYLSDAGKRIPFIDKAIYILEKESIPRWSKFQQGYYDVSGISSDSFDQAVKFNAGGAELTAEMIEKNIHLVTSVETSVFYMGFNMKDDVVGGNSTRARLLRQAIAIAVDFEEYISVFRNGRAIAGHSPLPPGIFGHESGEAGINPMVYTYENGKAVRKPLSEAYDLMTQAGYPGGKDPKTNKPLVLNYDTLTAGPDSKALLNWYRKQFKKLGIQLNIRSTDYNRFQDKMRKGNSQIFSWGWNADYPDPENFLFLLYGPNGKVDHKGENATNYDSPAFNRLFEQMKNIPDSEQRLVIIKQMLTLLRTDVPWLFGFHPKQFSLYRDWYYNPKPNVMGRNTLKYRRIDAEMRYLNRNEWNKPVVWPLWTILILMGVALIYGAVFWRKRDRSSAL